MAEGPNPVGTAVAIADARAFGVLASSDAIRLLDAADAADVARALR
jgi:hypothetical protein